MNARADKTRIDYLIRRIEQDFRDLRIAVGGASPSAEPTTDISHRELPSDLIRAAAAAERVGRSRGRMREWCRKHPIGEPGGFAVNISGRWFVSAALLRAHIASAAKTHSSERNRRYRRFRASD